MGIGNSPGADRGVAVLGGLLVGILGGGVGGAWTKKEFGVSKW